MTIMYYYNVVFVMVLFDFQFLDVQLTQLLDDL